MLYCRFRAECKSSGKSLMVWTVNDPDHMMEVRLVIGANLRTDYECDSDGCRQ